MTLSAPTHALVATLGASWAVIPEIVGWLAPEALDLYAHHPERDTLARERADAGLAAPATVHVVTTEGEQARESVAALLDWWQRLGKPFALHIWQAAGTDQLATPDECAVLRELTFRVVARARAEVSGRLWLSLAGGRKTMSADLQAAGEFFGSDALLHVIDTGKLPEALRRPEPALLAAPLAAELARHLRPLVVGRQTPSELAALAPAIDAAHHPLPDAAPGTPCRWQPEPEPDHARCADAVARRLLESQQLLGNFVAELRRNEPYDNWPSLYRLPPATLRHLRDTRLEPHHRDWLVQLPKADLHRHLGGSLSLDQQQTVARALVEVSTPEEHAAAHAAVAPLLEAARHGRDWPWDWPECLRAPEGTPPAQALRHRAACAAALLLDTPPDGLERQLYGATEPRVALKTRHPHGFAAYERPGELTGSAVLGHPAALAPYARALVDNARAEGLVYLELRGSPHKYRPDDPVGFLADLAAALVAAGAITPDQPHALDALESRRASVLIGFIWILDRRAEPAETGRIIESAACARERLGAFLLGLDLAGDEGQRTPDALAPHFEPAFRACLPITIHAGEGESADNIWQAAYQLHADRIGHGLTLADHPALAQRFRDRRILLELCPSSNREVIGYRDPAHSASVNEPDYPLAALMHEGIPLTLCTDNPGISLTTLADEYLAAARMLGDTPLTRWQTLALVRQAFAHAFLPARLRDRLGKMIDRRVHALVLASPTA